MPHRCLLSAVDPLHQMKQFDIISIHTTVIVKSYTRAPVFVDLSMFNNSSMKMLNRVGDSKLPCRIPLVIQKVELIEPFHRTVAVVDLPSNIHGITKTNAT